MKIFFLYSAAVLLMAGCTKGPDTGGTDVPIPDPVLVVDTTPIAVDADGETGRVVTVESNGTWTATIENAAEKTWITIEGATGTDNGSFKVNISRNGVITARDARIVVTRAAKESETGSPLTKEIAVTQSAADGDVTIDKQTITADSAGKTDKIAVASNGVAWSAQIDYTGGDAGWITLGGTTSGTTDGEISVTIGPKADVGSRTANILVSYEAPQGEQPATPYEVVVTQTGVAPALSVAPVSTESAPLAFDKAGEAKTITVTANVPWTVNNANAQWVTVTEKTGDTGGAGGSFKINALLNDSFNARTGHLTVSASEIGAPVTIYVSQAPNKVPTYSVKLAEGADITAANVKLNAVKDSLQVFVSSNISWKLTVSGVNATIPRDASGAAGVNNLGVWIRSSENGGGELTGQIKIEPSVQVEGSSAITHTIKQAAASDPRAWFTDFKGRVPHTETTVIAKEGATIAATDPTNGLKVVANGAWTIDKGGADWITVAESGTGDTDLGIVVAQNQTETPRQTTLALKLGSATVHSVVVKQAIGEAPPVTEDPDGITINGVTWAKYYLGIDGDWEKTGSSSAVALYQFNYNYRFPATGGHIRDMAEPDKTTYTNAWRTQPQIVTLNDSSDWQEENDPCPAGWGVPTTAQYANSLLVIRNTPDANGNKSIYVSSGNGYYAFGPGAAAGLTITSALEANTLFVPLTYRRGKNLSNEGYLSSTTGFNIWTKDALSGSSTTAYGFYDTAPNVGTTQITIPGTTNRNNALAIRCVKDGSKTTW